MRILFLESGGAQSGDARVLLDLLTGVRRARPHWTLTLCASGDGALVQQARALGVQTIIVPLPALLSSTADDGLRFAATAAAVPEILSYGLKLRARLRDVDPDVMHSNSLRMHLAAAWTKPARARLVWHLHDYVSLRSRSAALLRRSAGACSAIVANSQSVADDAQSALRVSVLPRAIRNSVDLTVFTPTGPAAALDSLATLPSSGTDTVRVGLVASYATGKGQFTFLEALAALPASLQVRGYVIGGPTHKTTGSQCTRKELEAAANALGLANRVGFIGFQARPADVYRALDVVVHASTQPEPFGRVVAEAMACGRAVIAANGGGEAEIIDAGVDGLVHRAGDARDLAAVIERLAVTPALRHRLAAEARRTAERSLGTGALVRDFCRLYYAIVHRPTLGPVEPHAQNRYPNPTSGGSRAEL